MQTNKCKHGRRAREKFVAKEKDRWKTFLPRLLDIIPIIRQIAMLTNNKKSWISCSSLKNKRNLFKVFSSVFHNTVVKKYREKGTRVSSWKTANWNLCFETIILIVSLSIWDPEYEFILFISTYSLYEVCVCVLIGSQRLLSCFISWMYLCSVVRLNTLSKSSRHTDRVQWLTSFLILVNHCHNTR